MAEYIERDAAIDRIADLMATGFVEDRFVLPHELQALQDELATLPVADVEPVMHAHWIKTFGSGGMLVGWKCSAPDCGVLSCYKGAYCPNCGAKMDEEERK